MLGTLLVHRAPADRPLHRAAARRRPRSARRSTARRRWSLFFAAIGLGFMLIETSQMQRLIVVLGHPTYGLTVVLFSLLLSSGLGSCADAARSRRRRRGRPALVRLAAARRRAVRLRAGRRRRWRTASKAPSTPVRIAVSALVLAVPGVLMGMAFPLGHAAGARTAAGADAVAVGRQRRDVGLRLGAGGGHRAQHDHLDGVLDRLAVLPRGAGGLRLAATARAGSSRRSGHDGGVRRRRQLEATGYASGLHGWQARHEGVEW